jgi:hypothetical protein
VGGYGLRAGSVDPRRAERPVSAGRHRGRDATGGYTADAVPPFKAVFFSGQCAGRFRRVLLQRRGPWAFNRQPTRTITQPGSNPPTNFPSAREAPPQPEKDTLVSAFWAITIAARNAVSPRAVLPLRRCRVGESELRPPTRHLSGQGRLAIALRGCSSVSVHARRNPSSHAQAGAVPSGRHGT